MESLIEHAINLELDVPIRLVRVVPGRRLPYRHNYCRAWADALDDFHYRVVETPSGSASWCAVATRALGAAFDHDPDLGGMDTVDAYVAGPTGFTDVCRRLLLEGGVPEERVKTDSLA